MDHKNEIIETRTGGLGSSDADMVYSIGKNGKISESQKVRLAVMLGLERQKQFSTQATDYGNFIEQKVFETLKEYNPDFASNPYNKYEEYSKRYGFDVFNHIDFEIEGEASLIWVECKAVNSSLDETVEKYKNQLRWHQMIGLEKAKRLNKTFTLYLLHYHTNDKESDFDASNMTYYLTDITGIEIVKEIFENGLEIIKKEIENFEYKKSEELSTYILPENVQKSIEEVYLSLKEIDSLNKKVEEFKAKILSLMQENNVKSIDNELFKITTVAGSESISFDSKAFQKENTELYQKYLTKKIERKPFVKITMK